MKSLKVKDTPDALSSQFPVCEQRETVCQATCSPTNRDRNKTWRKTEAAVRETVGSRWSDRRCFISTLTEVSTVKDAALWRLKHCTGLWCSDRIFKWSQSISSYIKHTVSTTGTNTADSHPEILQTHLIREEPQLLQTVYFRFLRRFCAEVMMKNRLHLIWHHTDIRAAENMKRISGSCLSTASDYFHADDEWFCCCSSQFDSFHCVNICKLWGPSQFICLVFKKLLDPELNITAEFVGSSGF